MSGLVVDLLRPDEIDASIRGTWEELLSANPHLESPMFRPEFFEAVGAVRANLFLGVVRRKVGGDPFLLVPFRRRNRVGKTFAGTLSRLDGWISGAGEEFDAEEVVAGCGLTSWRFHRLCAAQAAFRDLTYAFNESPFVETSLLQEDPAPEVLQRLTAERGPLSAAEEEPTDRLIDWFVEHKRRELRQARAWDYLGLSWTVPALRAAATIERDCRMTATTLRFGEELAGVALGLRSKTVHQSWLIGIDCSWAAGVEPLLIAEVSVSAGRDGYDRVELGAGREPYKDVLATGSTPLGEGAAETNALPRRARRVWYAAREFVRQTPLAGPAHRVVNRLRTWKRRWQPAEPIFRSREHVA